MKNIVKNTKSKIDNTQFVKKINNTKSKIDNTQFVKKINNTKSKIDKSMFMIYWCKLKKIRKITLKIILLYSYISEIDEDKHQQDSILNIIDDFLNIIFFDIKNKKW
jgi:hypothetical protein